MGNKKSTLNPSKFQISNLNPEKVSDHKPKKFGLQLITQSDQYNEHHCTEILQGSEFSKNGRLKSNGFVGTVVECYCQHHNLVIRPDDVWIAIMVQFSFYINKEAEKFRKKFVNFEGKKQLTVYAQGSLRTVSYPFLIKSMTEEIDKNLVDPEVKGWVLPSFSTTTENDKLVCGVVLMAAMKKYFDYAFGLTCGIPYVTLEGTVEDWEDIEGRLEKLKEYELEWWYDLLKPIVQEFVDTKMGKPDLNFWGRICTKEVQDSGPTYLSGWITTFCIFDKDGNQQGFCEGNSPWRKIEITDIPTGSVEVDVKILEGMKEHNSVIFAGHLMTEIMKDGVTLRPHAGWALCLKPNAEEEQRLDKQKEMDDTELTEFAENLEFSNESL